MQYAPERPVVPEVTVQEAWERAQRGQAVIVDVREPHELDEVSVDEAIHIPMGDLPARVHELPDDREILFLCRSGNRSSFTTDLAIRAGYPSSRNIAGGIIDWVQANLPHRRGRRSPS